MLVELAIGDAYGAGFEYADPDATRPNDCRNYYKHPTHGIGAGRYTDDTQMSIAVAETMLAHRDPAPYDFIVKFVECFKRDPRVGYSRHFQKFLEEISHPGDFVSRINPDSDKSGGAMRTLPIGCYGSVGRVKLMAERQASTTHKTRDGVNAAKAAALSAHYFLYRLGPRAELGDFLNREVPGRDWSARYAGKVGAKGLDSAHAAISALIDERNRSLTDVLRAAIAYTGDVDTVAAIAMGAAAHCPDLKNDLAQSLYDGLEKGKFGLGFLTALDHQVMQFARREGAPI